MSKWLVYSIASLLSVLALLFVVTFVISINDAKVHAKPLPAEQATVTDKNGSAQKSWLTSLSKDQDQDSYYPVTEISIDLNLLESVDQKFKHRVRYFKLQTQKLNDYHFFCLQQVLEQSHINHKIERFQDEIGVILYSNNQTTLNKIVKELKKYGINSAMHEIVRN